MKGEKLVQTLVSLHSLLKNEKRKEIQIDVKGVSFFIIIDDEDITVMMKEVENEEM